MSEETEDQLPRRIAAKDRLVELLDEATVRLEGVYEDRLIGILQGVGAQTAECAAVWGFSRPPIEHLIARPALLSPQLGIMGSLWMAPDLEVTDAYGGAGLCVRFDVPPNDKHLSESDPRTFFELMVGLDSWKRKVARLDAAEIRIATPVGWRNAKSTEGLIFDGQLRYELAGISRWFFAEMGPVVLEAVQQTKAAGWPVEATTARIDQILEVHFSGLAQRERSDHVQNADTEDKPVRLSPAQAKERAKKPIAERGYLGLRKLADLIGCSAETVRRCPDVQPHIPTKAPVPVVDSRDISELDVPADGPDVLDQLVEDVDIQTMLKSLPPEQRERVEEMTPIQQNELARSYNSQQADAREDNRPRYTRRRRKASTRSHPQLAEPEGHGSGPSSPQPCREYGVYWLSTAVYTLPTVRLRGRGRHAPIPGWREWFWMNCGSS